VVNSGQSLTHGGAAVRLKAHRASLVQVTDFCFPSILHRRSILPADWAKTGKFRLAERGEKIHELSRRGYPLSYGRW
jgi:hypothetical protein